MLGEIVEVCVYLYLVVVVEVGWIEIDVLFEVLV